MKQQRYYQTSGTTKQQYPHPMQSVSPELVCCDESTDHQVLVELIEGRVTIEHTVLCLKVRVRLEWSGGYYIMHKRSVVTTSSDIMSLNVYYIDA